MEAVRTINSEEELREIIGAPTDIVKAKLVPFLSLVSVPELARNPTVKEERVASGLPVASGLMFTYPVHQAADILFCHGNVVPVGKDQLPHLEMTRLIARRFNQRYSPAEPFFGEPESSRWSATSPACSGPTVRR